MLYIGVLNIEKILNIELRVGGYMNVFLSIFLTVFRQF